MEVQSSQKQSETQDTQIMLLPYLVPPQNTPIHHLPTELLTRIFRYVRTFQETVLFRCRPAWLIVTIVCRQWKEIAYSSPQLWSTIDYRVHKVTQTKRCLQLSKSLPLTINLGSAQVDTTKGLNQAIPRVRRLKMTWSGTWPNLRTLLSRPAPMLETLSLELQTQRKAEPMEERNLDHLFSSVKPPLRHLSITSFDPGCLLFPTLTILKIRSPTPQFRLLSFLTVLRNLPRLVSLCLSSVLDPPKLATRYIPLPSGTKVVDLPDLDFLSIDGPFFAQDLDLLSHLSFPSTAVLLFSSGYTYCHSRVFAAVADFLKIRAQVCRDIEKFLPTGIQFWSGPSQFTLKFWKDDNVLCAFELNHAGDGVGSRRCLPHEPDINEIFRHLYYPTITKFHTSCYIAPSVWRVISSSLPILEDITIHKDSPEDQLDATPILEAIIDDDQNKPLSGWTPILPQLRILLLSKITFDANCHENLVQSLLNRSHSDFKPFGGLEQFKIRECQGVSENLVEELKTIKGLDVNWVERKQDPERSLESFLEDLGMRKPGDEGPIEEHNTHDDQLFQYGIDACMLDDM